MFMKAPKIAESVCPNSRFSQMKRRIESEAAPLDRKVVQQHGFAVFCVAVATTLRYLLGLLWPDIIVFATYYPAVLLATLVCGVPVGITATLLGAVSAWWLFLPSTHQFLAIEPANTVSIILYTPTYRSLGRKSLNFPVWRIPMFG